MKKLTKILSLLIAAALCAALLAGCGNNDSSSDSASDSSSDSVSDSASDSASDSGDSDSDEDLDYSGGLDAAGNLEGVRALDYVTLPADYKSITVDAGDVAATEEEVQSQIDGILSNYSTSEEITDRAIEDGDYVNIDFSGSIDGEVFDGGTATDYTVLAGSNQFIDDFLTQIIGHTPGESFDVEVTFPDPYENNPDLANKDAVFAVTVNYIVGEDILPEFTDDFVKENLTSLYGWETAEAARTEITDTIRDSKLSDFVWGYVYDNAEVTEVPQAAIEYQEKMLENQVKSQAAMYGVALEDFLSAVQAESLDALVEQSAANIETAARQMMVIQAMVEDSALTVTDEDLSNYFYEEMGLDDYSYYEEHFGKPYLNMVVLSDQINTLLTGGAQTVEP